MTNALFKRLAEAHRKKVTIVVGGQPVDALAGDTLLTALLTTGTQVRESEFGDGPRAGFCLIGACQDCWVELEDGGRVRACGTFVIDGLRVHRKQGTL